MLKSLFAPLAQFITGNHPPVVLVINDPMITDPSRVIPLDQGPTLQVIKDVANLWASVLDRSHPQSHTLYPYVRRHFGPHAHDRLTVSQTDTDHLFFIPNMRTCRDMEKAESYVSCDVLVRLCGLHGEITNAFANYLSDRDRDIIANFGALFTVADAGPTSRPTTTQACAL